jgi:ABC-type sugar transport system ATPase subunit
MRDGLNMQVADPLTLYRQPENLFVAGFVGSPPMHLLKGKVQRRDDGLFFAEAGEKNALTRSIREAPLPIKELSVEGSVEEVWRRAGRQPIILRDRLLNQRMVIVRS